MGGNDNLETVSNSRYSTKKLNCVIRKTNMTLFQTVKNDKYHTF